MSNALPSGWESVILGDVTIPKVDQGPPSHVPVPYIDISSIDRHQKAIGDLRTVDADSAPTRARQWVHTGDVLVSMTRPNLNAVALIPERLDGSVASTGFDVLRTIEVHPEWVFNRVRSHAFIADVCEDLQGVVYPAIRPHDVREHELPLPPLPEQHRIVEAIESYLTRLDDAVATLERVQQNLKRYRASVLKAAVEGRLVPTEAELAKQEGRDYEPASMLLERILVERRERWIEDAAEKGRAKAEEKANKAGRPWTKKDDAKALETERAKVAKKYKEPAAPVINDLPELPGGWCWVTVDQLSMKITDGEHLSPSTIQDGVFLLSAKDVRDHGVVFDNPKFVSQEDAERFRLRCDPNRGDVLIVSRGATIGRTTVVQTDRQFCLMGSVILIRIVELIDPHYLSLCLRSTSGQQRLVALSGSTAQQAIYLRDIRSLPVPLPPSEEQQRVCEEVERLLSIGADTESGAAQSSRRCQRLRQSILKWAFEGKLVDQDSNDEPASALLERIKIEREAMTPTKTNNRRGGRRKKVK